MKANSLANFLILALFISPAFAGTDAVKTCSNGLTEPAKLIVQTAMPKLTPKVDARDVLKSTVIDLVKSGKIKRSEARSSARAAVQCLQRLKD